VAAKGTRVLAEIPEVVEYHGYRYRLDGMSTGPLASGPLPRTSAPAGPSVVVWGSAGDTALTATPGTPGSLRLDGVREAREDRSLGTWGPTPVPAGSARTPSLVAEGSRPDGGTAFIAVYTLES
jgi:hypothetical protein